MKGRSILAAIFLLIGLAAGWMTWLMARADEDSKWLFGVFAAFFLLLAAAPFLPRPKKKKAESLNTRFVPAWQMEGMIFLAVLFLALALIVPHCIHPAK
ncbi:MAG TPA: hypothetical protein VMI53_02595 [Opitutaceae bacterium]|nr:hypothetical protein [Opitutaceae bacterium]